MSIFVMPEQVQINDDGGGTNKLTTIDFTECPRANFFDHFVLVVYDYVHLPYGRCRFLCFPLLLLHIKCLVK